ncbi:hypothetical protein ACUXAV_002424 [Cupriavidus metallidurans]|jgi:hypothetical protein|nr:hypothetical protein AU374_00502 [Cupriavidus metallidurans]
MWESNDKENQANACLAGIEHVADKAAAHRACNPPSALANHCSSN